MRFYAKGMGDKWVSLGSVRAGKQRGVRKYVRAMPKKSSRVVSVRYDIDVSEVEFPAGEFDSGSAD